MRDSMDGKSAVIISFALLWIVQSTDAFAPRSDSVRVNCTGAFDKVEACATGNAYSFIHPGYEHPTNPQELITRCAISMESLACFKKYAKCFDPIVREAMLSFVRGRMVRVNAHCKNSNPETTRFMLESFKCLRDHKAKSGANLERNLLIRLDGVSSADNMDFGQRVKMACCNILDFKEKFHQSLLPQCEKYVAVVDEDILSYIGELIPLLCAKYGDAKLRPNKECSNLPKLVSTQPVKSKSLGSAIVAIGATIGKQ